MQVSKAGMEVLEGSPGTGFGASVDVPWAPVCRHRAPGHGAARTRKTLGDVSSSLAFSQAPAKTQGCAGREAPDPAHQTRPSHTSLQPVKGSETPDGRGAGGRSPSAICRPESPDKEGQARQAGSPPPPTPAQTDTTLQSHAGQRTPVLRGEKAPHSRPGRSTGPLHR